MLSVSSGVFKDMTEAIKKANSIKIWLQRLCIRKKYSCKAIIGVSQYNPKTGTISVIKTGKRGRPKLTFIRTNYYLPNHKTQPHIHIILYGNPADMICSLISDLFNRKDVWYNECEEYVEDAVLYILKQSQNIRTVEIDENKLLSTDKQGFYSAIDKANKILGITRIKFTLSEPQEQNTKLDTISNLILLAKKSLLQCNSNNIYDRYIKLVNKYIVIYVLKTIRKYIPP